GCAGADEWPGPACVGNQKPTEKDEQNNKSLQAPPPSPPRSSTVWGRKITLWAVISPKGSLARTRHFTATKVPSTVAAPDSQSGFANAVTWTVPVPSLRSKVYMGPPRRNAFARKLLMVPVTVTGCPWKWSALPSSSLTESG